MQRLMKSIAFGLVLSGALLACYTQESAAQVVVTSYYPSPPVVRYMRVRRGLFGLRRAYIPVVSYVLQRAVTSYYAPATPITTYYAPPVTTYYAPAEPVTTYYAPAVTTYDAPAEPITTYYAPATPTTTYYAPPVTTYYAPAEPITTYRVIGN